MKANIFKILLLKPIFLILAYTPWSRGGLVMVQRVAKSSGVQCSVLPSDTLSVNPAVYGNFFRIREGSAFICCAQDTQEL